VFTRYLDLALTQDFFNHQTISKEFNLFFKMFHQLALNGQTLEGAAYFKFMYILNQQMKDKESN